MTRSKQDLLRQLPAVDSLLLHTDTQTLIEHYSRQIVTDAIRTILQSTREHILNNNDTAIDSPQIIDLVSSYLARQFQPTLRPVINATGVIIHTNLGRALLSKAAQSAIVEVANNYNTLEFDLENGKRGSRLIHASQLLRELTGADDAIVVNNNAAALIMILTALAKDKDVVISRGQLVEIGGGFRIPAIMEQSGAHLVEVGTTNRTRIGDYASAVTDNSSMFLRVHASNFKQIGFVEQASLSDLVRVAHEHNIICADDLGSGTLIETEQFGMAHEPSIQESVSAGVDLICFSGDKLLGGPQAGIIIGKQAIIDQLKKHPLARALRVDKLTYAALTATLDHYRKGEALEQIPVWQMISRSIDDLRQTAQNWSHIVGGTVIEGESTVGGGSLPGTTLPTALLAMDCDLADAMMERLRAAQYPVIARVADGRVLFDPRTVLAEQEMNLLDTIKYCKE